MDFSKLNTLAAWFGILAGVIAGLVQGLFFHKEEWLGGYTSWKRRMVRLAHISFFGIGFVNLAFAFAVYSANIQSGIVLPSYLFIIGAITMPIVCYLSAFKKFFRNLFFIPVLSVLVGTVVFILGGLLK